MRPSMRKARFERHLGLPLDGSIAVYLLVVCAIGCTPLPKPSVRPLLRQPRMSANSIVLDVFLLRAPFGDPEMNGPAWQEIDEQPFPADVRRLLLANGFRFGVLAGQLPAEWTKRLELADNKTLPGEISELKVDDLAQQPAVLRGHFQLRAGARKELTLGPTRDKLNVLLRDAGGNVSGKSYDQAELLLAVTARPMDDGRVQLAMVPEITCGQYRQGWSADSQGILRLSPGRESRTFDEMKLEAVLSPGHSLVMSAVPLQPGSLGGQFFTEPSGEQIFLLLRLSQTQHDGQFDREVDLAIE